MTDKNKGDDTFDENKIKIDRKGEIFFAYDSKISEESYLEVCNIFGDIIADVSDGENNILSENIHEKIFKSKLFIADLTGHSEWLYFEIGLATANKTDQEILYIVREDMFELIPHSFKSLISFKYREINDIKEQLWERYHKARNIVYTSMGKEIDICKNLEKELCFRLGIKSCRTRLMKNQDEKSR